VNKSVCFLVLLLLPSLAMTETLRDPTRPLFQKKVVSEKPKPDPYDAAPGLKLQGIILGLEQRMAIINSTRLRAGDRIAGHHVETIGPRQVILMKNGQERTLSLSFVPDD